MLTMYHNDHQLEEEEGEEGDGEEEEEDEEEEEAEDEEEAEAEEEEEEEEAEDEEEAEEEEAPAAAQDETEWGLPVGLVPMPHLGNPATAIAAIQDGKFFVSFGELFKGLSQENATHVTNGETIAQMRQTRQLQVNEQMSKKRKSHQATRTVDDFTIELTTAIISDMKTIRDSHNFKLPSFARSDTSFARAFFQTYQEFGMKCVFNKALHQKMQIFFEVFAMHFED